MHWPLGVEDDPTHLPRPGPEEVNLRALCQAKQPLGGQNNLDRGTGIEPFPQATGLHQCQDKNQHGHQHESPNGFVRIAKTCHTRMHIYRYTSINCRPTRR